MRLVNSFIPKPVKRIKAIFVPRAGNFYKDLVLNKSCNLQTLEKDTWNLRKTQLIDGKIYGQFSTKFERSVQFSIFRYSAILRP